MWTFAYQLTEPLRDAVRRVLDQREPALIQDERGESVVMIPLSEYESLEETAHLLRNPANARRLAEAIEQLDQGQGAARELAE